MKTSQELRVAIQKIEKEYELYKEGAKKLKRVSSKFRGLNRAVEIIENAV